MKAESNQRQSKAEMHQAVVEVGTDICEDIDEAYKDVATIAKNHFRNCRRPWVMGRRSRHASFQPLGKPADHRSCHV